MRQAKIPVMKENLHASDWWGDDYVTMQLHVKRLTGYVLALTKIGTELEGIRTKSWVESERTLGEKLDMERNGRYREWLRKLRVF